MLTIGLDLGDRSSCYCVLDDVLMEQKLSTTPKAIKETFGAMPRSRTALEASESLQVTNFSNPTPISQLRQGPPEATYPPPPAERIHSEWEGVRATTCIARS